MPRWVFFFCFFVLEFIRWSSCTWTLALCEGKSLFLAKCSVTNLSDYRMDFLYLGALDSIQGAKGIGFHSVFGHAGHFLFWFFMREECSLLAYLLVGSMPEQEMHSVPPIPTAEQNGFIDPKHNCLPHAKAWVLDLPAKWKQPCPLAAVGWYFYQGSLCKETSSVNLRAQTDFPSLDSEGFFPYHLYIYIYFFFFTIFTSFCRPNHHQIFMSPKDLWKTAKMNHLFSFWTRKKEFILKESRISDKELRGGSFCPTLHHNSHTHQTKCPRDDAQGLHFLSFFFFSFFLNRFSLLIWLHRVLVWAWGTFSHSMPDLVRWPRMEPGPPALRAQRLSHWTIRESPQGAHF